MSRHIGGTFELEGGRATDPLSSISDWNVDLGMDDSSCYLFLWVLQALKGSLGSRHYFLGRVPGRVPGSHGMQGNCLWKERVRREGALEYTSRLYSPREIPPGLHVWVLYSTIMRRTIRISLIELFHSENYLQYKCK
jgi:hypothetical protein